MVIISSILLLFLVFLILLSWAPLISKLRNQYIYNGRLHYGSQAFRLIFPAKKLIGPIIAVLLQIIFIFMVIGFMAWFIASIYDIDETFFKQIPHYLKENSQILLWINLLSFFIFSFVYWLLFACYIVAVYNLRLNHLSLDGGISFTSSMKLKDYMVLVFQNIMLCILSLGLLYPWAVIRFRRYQLSVTQLRVKGGIGNYVNHQKQAGGATAAEFGAMEGISDGVGDGIFG